MCPLFELNSCLWSHNALELICFLPRFVWTVHPSLLPHSFLRISHLNGVCIVTCCNLVLVNQLMLTRCCHLLRLKNFRLKSSSSSSSSQTSQYNCKNCPLGFIWKIQRYCLQKTTGIFLCLKKACKMRSKFCEISICKLLGTWSHRYRYYRKECCWLVEKLWRKYLNTIIYILRLKNNGALNIIPIIMAPLGTMWKGFTKYLEILNLLDLCKRRFIAVFP